MKKLFAVKKMVLLITVIFVIILAGCATGSPKQDPNTPPWLNDLPPSDYIWGIGIAKQSSEQQSMTFAEARGRTAIARQLDTLVQAMLTDYNRDAGTTGSKTALSLQEDVSRQITNIRLQNAQPIQRWKSPDGTWWYLVQYRKADAKKDIAAIFDNEAARYAEFKANEALRMMDAQLQKNERPLQVND